MAGDWCMGASDWMLWVLGHMYKCVNGLAFPCIHQGSLVQFSVLLGSKYIGMVLSTPAHGKARKAVAMAPRSSNGLEQLKQQTADVSTVMFRGTDSLFFFGIV